MAQTAATARSRFSFSPRGNATSSAWPASPPMPQDAQLQRDALTEAGCGRIFEEKVSTYRDGRSHAG